MHNMVGYNSEVLTAAGRSKHRNKVFLSFAMVSSSFVFYMWYKVFNFVQIWISYEV